jgi:hypothetical protein
VRLSAVSECDDFSPDERPNQRLEPGALFWVRECDPRHGSAIYVAVRGDLNAPSIDYLGCDVRLLVELMDHCVGR